MPDRSGVYGSLPTSNPPLKGVTDALIELDEVLTAGAFDKDQIWGTSAVDDVAAYMNGLTPGTKLQEAWNNLTQGVGGSQAVGDAIDKALSGIQGFLDKVNEQAKAFDVPGRLNAFRALNNPNGGNYAPSSADGPFGFFPALAGIANAAGADIDTQKVNGALEALESAAGAAEGFRIFVQFAVSSMALLKRALNR